MRDKMDNLQQMKMSESGSLEKKYEMLLDNERKLKDELDLVKKEREEKIFEYQSLIQKEREAAKTKLRESENKRTLREAK
jgi:hypothetical protein